MTDEELGEKLGESRQELFRIRFQAATGGLESSARLRRTRQHHEAPKFHGDED